MEEQTHGVRPPNPSPGTAESKVRFRDLRFMFTKEAHRATSMRSARPSKGCQASLPDVSFLRNALPSSLSLSWSSCSVRQNGWHISDVHLRYCKILRLDTVDSNAQARERISELAPINESQRCKMFRIHKILNCRTSKDGLQQE
jgi:hypothetical protein